MVVFPTGSCTLGKGQVIVADGEQRSEDASCIGCRQLPASPALETVACAQQRFLSTETALNKEIQSQQR